MPPGFDHTAIEKELIKERGGTPRESFGVDGTMPDGDPVEVRLAKKDSRFRVNKDTHKTLVDEGGSYLFDKIGDGVPPKEVSAGRVDDLLGDDFHSDRGYMHQFVPVEDIF